MATSSSRWLIGVASVIALLIVVSVAVTALNPGGEAEELPADTPEGVVQRYLQALQAQDYPLARSYYSTDLQGNCTAEDIQRSSRWMAEGPSRRIELVDTQPLGDGTTQVRVTVTEVNVTPPFGVSETSHDEWYVLAQEDGAWRLDSPGWPVYTCPGIRGLL